MTKCLSGLTMEKLQFTVIALKRFLGKVVVIQIANEDWIELTYEWDNLSKMFPATTHLYGQGVSIFGKPVKVFPTPLKG